MQKKKFTILIESILNEFDRTEMDEEEVHFIRK